MLPKEVIILGGGASVVPAIEKGLFDILPQTFCVGLNYSYKFVNTTAVCGVDEVFYNDEIKQGLRDVPLFIGKEHYSLQNRADNSIFFKCHDKYDRELTNGVYTPTLTGLFSLSLLIRLIGEGNIYLLGYDYGPLKNDQGDSLCDANGKPLTHWYQGKLDHRGVGKINWYSATVIDYEVTQKRISHAEKEFRPYADERGVKIWNVSSGSAIPYFEKISYESFLTKIESNRHNQEQLRKDLRESLEALKKEKGL